MLKGYKTIVINAVIAVFGVLEATDWVNTVGSDKAGMVATVLAVVGMVLRYFTTTPLGKKD
jgi:hypothetical protein